MSDHPADIHDGADPVEPTPEPEQVEKLATARFAYSHQLTHVEIPQGQRAFVTAVDHEAGTATVIVRLPGIEVPLDLLERGQR